MIFLLPEHDPPKSGGKQDPKMAPETILPPGFSLTEHPPFGLQVCMQLLFV